ncbi:putative protein phosphatase [Arabidopsis thaliana]|nr:putative protein phosphatase [Arabidopsis thaliana]
MAGFLSVVRRVYLTLYNWIVFAGWQVLYLAITTLKETGYENVYDAIEKPLQLAQTAAVLEISCFCNSATDRFKAISHLGHPIQFSRGPISFSCYVAGHKLVYHRAQIIRYSFFGFKEALGFAPSWHLWLRYSSFLLLYPTGITSEVGLIYLALPHIKTSEMYSVRMPNILNFSFDFFYATILVLAIYVPGTNSVNLSYNISHTSLSPNPRGNKRKDLERDEKAHQLFSPLVLFVHVLLVYYYNLSFV